MDNLQHRIKTTRLNRGFSQSALAEMTGVSQPTVANWENGSHIPRHRVLEKIGRALGVEPVWLLAGDFGESETLAQSYLRHPIRHVPVFAWPASSQEFQGSPPLGYVPYSTSAINVIGVLHRHDLNQTPDILICNPTDRRIKPGYLFLTEKGGQLALTPTEKLNGSVPIARVLCTMNFHSAQQKPRI